MGRTKLTLCEDCCCCPEIELLPDTQEMVIKDDFGGKVRLPKSAWNVLVKFVKDEKLREI
jgi:hypothetical protein